MNFMEGAQSCSGQSSRRRLAHYALGNAAEMRKDVLPLEVDVYNDFKFEQEKMKEESGKTVNNVKNYDVAATVARKVIDVWENKGNLPVISEKR